MAWHLRHLASACQSLLPAITSPSACAAARSVAIHESQQFGSLLSRIWSTEALNIPSNTYTASSFAASSSHRTLSTSQSSWHGGGSKEASGETITVVYIDKENKEHTVQAPLGKNLLEVAHDNEIDLEGACEASLACSTCHLIFENEEYFKKVPEPTEDELDMLDLAFGLTETSRLGCQVITSKELDGVRVRIPAASRNFYVDGHKPKPH